MKKLEGSMLGYQHPLYAQSFSEIGEPLYLPASKGWLIKRRIQDTEYYDAIGPYPLFFCSNWDLLLTDLDEFKKDLVSITFVVGPLEKIPCETYRFYFDKFFPYKNHYLIDYSKSIKKTISPGRRKESRLALRDLSIEINKSPKIDIDEWVALYTNLVKRHSISGISLFSYSSLVKHFSIPDTYYFRSRYHDMVVGANVYILQNNAVYYHLSAISEKGYETNASYALKWTAINYFSDHVRWMNLGGGISTIDGELDGLSQFKKGWSNTIKPSYFCGKILEKEIYNELCKGKINENEDVWFPLYRQGDFS